MPEIDREKEEKSDLYALIDSIGRRCAKYVTKLKEEKEESKNVFIHKNRMMCKHVFSCHKDLHRLKPRSNFPLEIADIPIV